MQFVVVLGRVFYSAIFIVSSFKHFFRETIEYGMSHGVPMAPFLVPFSGFLALAGGLSILLGYKARYGAWLLVIFLVPVTLTMHRFWGPMDPQLLQIEQIMFMKNLALLGAALMFTRLGSGPMSLDKK